MHSHYLTYPFHRSPEAFSAFIEDVQKIVENAPDGAELCGPNCSGLPVINNSMLIIGSMTNENAFSTLKLDRDEPWPKHRFPIITVRTNKLPYDTVICACLLAFVKHFPTSTITTDGNSNDWKQGIALYEYATEMMAPSVDFQNE